MTSPLRFTILSAAALLLAACAASGPSASATPAPAATATAAGLPASPTAQAQSQATPSTQQWDQPPALGIDPDQIYLARLKTDKGDITAELFTDKAPLTVNNFVFLAREGFYDNTTFHRVLANFMAQGGDPTASGAGGPGYRFADEFHPDLTFDQGGYLAMANSGPNTNGSQFFITFAPTPWLNFQHTIFGKVVEGMEVALALTLRDPDQGPTFAGDTLRSVEIEEVAESRLPPPTPTPVPVVPVMEDGRPLAELEIVARENLFTGRPEMAIDPARRYTATVSTSKGEIVIELDAQAAPESVNNFVVLAQLGYWDNFPIVFVQPDLFVLTGSPRGTPDSDAGYAVPPEPGAANVEGAVGYWPREDRRGSSASQFYILLEADPRLDAQFTVFGMVVEGLEVAQSLTQEDKIERVEITSDE